MAVVVVDQRNALLFDAVLHATGSPGRSGGSDTAGHDAIVAAVSLDDSERALSGRVCLGSGVEATDRSKPP